MRYRLMHPRLSALAALATCALCLPLLANQAEASTASSEPFDTVFTFDGYASGPLGGQQGWETSSDSVTVTTDPASADNNVLEMTGPNLWARHSLPAIQNGNTGTIFFRMWRGALVDASVGLSDVPAPTTFNDFEVQANNQRSATLNARDGSRFSPAGIFAQGAWQCIWMVADNAADHYRMYSLGGPYQSITQLPTETDELFGFRNGLQDTPLQTFFSRNGAVTPGTFYLDDIAVDSDAANLTVPSGNPDDCQYTGSGNYPVLDPIKGHPRQSGFGLTLQPYTQIPAARPTSPTARINYLGQVPDHSGRMFVPDLYGSLYLLQDGVPHKYLDVASAFPDFVSSPGLGTGFGFVAFAPDFQRTGKFYTVHTEAGAALSRKDPGELPAPEQVAVEGVVTEWTADDPSADTFHGTHREVLRIGFHTFVHGLQQIAFNPTARPGDPDYGLLYIGVGDGMEQPDFTHIAQNLGMPHGKLLRIDPNGTDGIGGGYGIPKSNPFVGQAGVLGSIYVYGLRNPHRFSWDRARPHRMILTNIGESSIESIYIVHPGDNYGWNEREGQFLYKPSDPRNVYPLPEDDSKYGYTYPVASLDHDEIRSIVGGFVYRGKALPELRGKYIFGDIVSGKIWYTEASEMQRGGPQTPVYQFNLFELYPGNTVTMQQLAGSSRVDLRLGEDANGEIYVLSKANGKIWKVTGAHQVGACKVEGQRLTDVMGRENWRPLNPDLWQFPGDAAILTQPGSQPPGPRRPYEYAVLTAGLPYASVQIDAQVRIDTPVSVTNRDVVLLFGFQSDTRFYYAHLGSDNSIYPHNGIFVVNDADRKRIDDQWNGTFGAPPAISDTNYHDVRIRFCAPTGEIAVYVDNMLNPLMTATDHTLHSGRLGFGSFDNYGRIRDVSIIGRPAKS